MLSLDLQCKCNGQAWAENAQHTQAKQLKDLETTKHQQKRTRKGEVLLIPFDGLLELLLRRLPKLYRLILDKSSHTLLYRYQPKLKINQSTQSTCHQGNFDSPSCCKCWITNSCLFAFAASTMHPSGFFTCSSQLSAIWNAPPTEPPLWFEPMKLWSIGRLWLGLDDQITRMEHNMMEYDGLMMEHDFIA